MTIGFIGWLTLAFALIGLLTVLRGAVAGLHFLIAPTLRERMDADERRRGDGEK